MTRRTLRPPKQLGSVADPSTLSTSTSGGVEVVASPASVVAVAVAEVLGFPIRLLRALPLPTTLVCSFAHEGGGGVLATASPASVPGNPPAPVFVGPEVDALALAAEHDRAVAATLRAWCAKKPDWR